MEIQNPNKNIIKIFFKLYIALIIVGIIMMGVPGLADYYFFPHIFGAGIFLAIIILFFSGKKLIPQIESLIKGERLLAKWNLDINASRKFADAELVRRKSDMHSTVFALFLGAILLYLFQFREITFVESIILGIAISTFGYIVGNLYIKSIHAKMYNSEGMVYIGYDGVLFNEEYHMWNRWGRRLANISFDENLMLLVFEYYSRGSKGAPNKRVARIPVPSENKIEAEKIIEMFKTERGIA